MKEANKINTTVTKSRVEALVLFYRRCTAAEVLVGIVLPPTLPSIRFIADVLLRFFLVSISRPTENIARIHAQIWGISGPNPKKGLGVQD